MSDPTKNFRQNYYVDPTNSQKRQYQEHQAAYQRMPPGTYDDLRRQGAAVEARYDQYEQRRKDRERVERETETARLNREDLRNARNREEKALARLDHEQSKYNSASSRYADTINGNHDNMTRVTTNRVTNDSSNNTLANEVVDGVTRHANVPAYPQKLPAPRLQKGAAYHDRRDTGR
ncbi:hypothetical protein VTK56DRAFT_6040 [Thermocarpiscus australiensis]